MQNKQLYTNLQSWFTLNAHWTLKQSVFPCKVTVNYESDKFSIS